MKLNSIVAFVAAHWGLILVVGYLLSDVAVAVTPKRYQTEKWYGLALKLFRYCSAHVHWDEPGTLQVPVLGIPVQLGKPASPTQPVPPSGAS